MEIRAKLSLAVNDFKSGLDTAKKELDSFGTSGSKFNSKFAKDVRSSFDQLGPNIKRSRREISREFDGIGKDIKSSVKNSLGNVWTPMQQGFSKATAKIAVNSSVVGGFFRNMTKSAAENAKAIDAYTERNSRNRIIGAQRAADFEARVAQANRRIDKGTMREQYGAKSFNAGSTAGLPAARSGSAGNRKPELEYTKWFENELKGRLGLGIKHEASYLARKVASSSKQLASETKYNAQIAAMWTRENAKRVAGDAKASAQIAGLWVASRAKQAVADAKYNRDYKALQRDSFAQKFNDPAFEKNMASTRYALYDVGQRFIAFGTAVAASLGQAVMASAKFESAFTSVERTSGVTGAAVGELRKQLLDLSTTIPVSFDQIAQIATLGAQMGIAADSLDAFSSTVAKFAAITGISVDEVAQSFGRLGQLMGVPASKFENLSSAITFAGSNAVATDKEVLAMSESIAAASTQAGYSADQVIGLSTALASLKVRPEEARGVIVRLFREIDLQTTTSGKRLQDFSKVMKMSTEDTKALWKSDPSKFFTSFISGAKAAGNLNEVITSLGITNSRELNVIQRLAGSQDMLAKSLEDARKQYLLGTYAQDSYNKVADDLASKTKVLQNTFERLSASIGDSMSVAVKFIVDKLKIVLDFLVGLPSPVKFAGAAIAILAATATLLFGGLAMGIAGLLAMKLAFNNLGKAGAEASISIATFRALLRSMTAESGLAGGALGLLGVKANSAAAGFRIAGMSAKAFQLSLGAIGLALVVATSLFEVFSNANKESADSLDKFGNATLEANGGMTEFLAAINKDTEAAAKGAGSLGKLTFVMSDTAVAAAKLEASNLKTAESVDALVTGVADGSLAIGDLAGATDTNTTAQDSNNASVQTGIDLQKEQVKQMGRATAAFLIQAAAKYSDGEGVKNFFVQQTEDKEITAAAEALGFNISDAVNAGLKKPGTGTAEYVNKLKSQWTELSDIVRSNFGTKAGVISPALSAELDNFASKNKLTKEQVASLSEYIKQNGQYLGDLPQYYDKWATANDGTLVATKNNIQATDKMNEVLQNIPGATQEAGDGIESLEGQLQNYINTLTDPAITGNAAVDAFEGVAAGAKASDGSIKGFSKNSRKNMSDWKSFMDSALKAGIAEGNAFTGAVGRMAAALIVLKGAGKDTSGQFAMMMSIIGSNLSQLGADYAGLNIALSGTKDLNGALKAVDTWLANNKTAAQAVLDTVNNLRAALAGGTFIPEFTSTFKEVEVTATKAKTAIEKMSEALDKLFEKFNRKINLEAAFDSLGASMAKNKKNFSIFTEEGRSNITALQDVIKNLAVNSNGNNQMLANSLASLKVSFARLGITGGTAINLINLALKGTGKSGKIIASEVKSALGSIKGSLTKTIAEETKKSIRLIGDYVSDMRGILDDAFNNRYGKVVALDEITSAWLDMKDAAYGAAKTINDAQAAIASIRADSKILEYQLSVAIKYGDTKRADAIRAKLAESNAKIAEEEGKIWEATQASSRALKGDSKAAIENRAKMRDLVQTYTSYLTTLAEAGMSSEDLKKQAASMSEEFVKQGKSLGFAEEDLLSYTNAMSGDFTKVVDKLPRDFTLNVETDPALRAIESFVLKANEELAKISVQTSPTVVPTTTISGQNESGQLGYYTSDGKFVLGKTGIVPTAAAKKAYHNAEDIVNLKKGTAAQIAAAQKSISWFETKYGFGYNKGGLVTGSGSGTSDSIPARLSNGEYVVKANAVSRYGVDFMNSLNQMRVARPMPSAGVGNASMGSSVVYLSPEDRQLLRAAVDRPIALYTENAKIAQSANAGNVVLAQRGSN